ncbi:MAG: zinc ribbon domain-containing protein [Burkholderiaceae bacterium]|nr:zinc ribbon domain-containing protein [Burkholderiaceae bacterium]
MPIYAYRCDDCGFAKDVLQKISDSPITLCPSCGKESFKKQLTAPGFQLKGTGWYATDFRGSGSAPSTALSTGPSGEGAAPAAPADAAPSAAATTKSTPSGTV